MKANSRLMAGIMAACVLSAFTTATAQATARPLSVQVEVICPVTSVRHRLISVLKKDLKAEGYVHGRPWPMLRLFVYAAPTVHNRKNPRGWSIAVAHAYFEPLLAAAYHLLKGKHNKTVPAGTSGRLFNILIHSQGTLTYLGVMNIDRLDRRKITLLAGNIINTFSKRWPPHGTAGPRPKPLPQLHQYHTTAKPDHPHP